MQSGQSQASADVALHSIIPAGGAGTRLWPLSRQGAPKFLLDLLGQGVSLLEATILRLAPISASVTIVTGPAHTEAGWNIGSQRSSQTFEVALRYRVRRQRIHRHQCSRCIR